MTSVGYVCGLSSDTSISVIGAGGDYRGEATPLVLAVPALVPGAELELERPPGTVYSCGRGGDQGCHGLGDTADHHEPTLVPALSDIPVTQMALGHSHGLALTGARIASLFCSHACPVLQTPVNCLLGGATRKASLVWATPRLSWRRFQWRPCGDAG